jgi:hypothetical protein
MNDFEVIFVMAISELAGVAAGSLVSPTQEANADPVSNTNLPW